MRIEKREVDRKSAGTQTETFFFSVEDGERGFFSFSGFVFFFFSWADTRNTGDTIVKMGLTMVLDKDDGICDDDE